MVTEKINNPAAWRQFAQSKAESKHLSAAEEKDLLKYVEDEQYAPLVAAYNAGAPFCHPTAAVINKQYSQKKRTVFIFPREENYFLSFIAFCLHEYDGIFAENLCSFRKSTTVKAVIRRLSTQNNVDGKYTCKVDVSDYFNSVEPTAVLAMLEKLLWDDKLLFEFIKNLLLDPYAYKDGKLIRPKKGIMAGMPISSFLANLYLSDTDRYFMEKGVTYMRYSDDVIIFSDTEAELTEHTEALKAQLFAHGLQINQSKVRRTTPGDGWEFLGFAYKNGVVDIAPVAVDKLKKKMKRKARAIYRWKIKKGANDQRAVAAFIKSFNRKLYENPRNDEITWTRWYFPVITTDASLKTLDAYMQDCIRYIARGNYSKLRYKLTYEEMKAAGYISLVNSYYRFKKNPT